MFADNPKFDGKDRATAIRTHGVPEAPVIAIGMLPHNRIIKQRHMFYFDNFVRDWGASAELEVVSTFVELMKDRFQLNHAEVDEVANAAIEGVKKNLDILGSEEQFQMYLDTHKAHLDDEYERRHGKTARITVQTFILYGYFGETDEKTGKNAEWEQYWETQVSAEHKQLCPQVMFMKNEKLGEWWPLDPVRHRDAKTDHYANEQLNMLMQQHLANVEFTRRQMAKEKQKALMEHQRAKELKAAEIGARFEQKLVDGQLTDPMGEAAKAAAAWADTAEGREVTAQEDAKRLAKAQIHRDALSAEALADIDRGNGFAMSVAQAMARAEQTNT